jgi:hypothetical protein
MQNTGQHLNTEPPHHCSVKRVEIFYKFEKKNLRMKAGKFLLSLFLLINVLTGTGVFGQNFCDTLFTRKGDTIPCMITMINDQNVFYHQKVKRRVVEDLYIARNQLVAFALHSPGVTVPPQGEEPSQPDTPNTFTENDGIIYASSCDKPPSFKGGTAALYSQLENSVNVTTRDAKIYGDNVVTVLYQLVILDDGRIYGGGIAESCIQNYGLDTQASILEKEILKKICLAGNWEPGSIDGGRANMNIYLPIKFSIDKNRIVIYPAKYMYLFKHRKQ